MAITGLKTWITGDALNATNLNNDKGILEAKFSAGIATADLSASAGIVNAQLANSHYEMIVSLIVQPTTAVQPPISATVPIAIVGLPGNDTTDGVSYTPVSATVGMVDTGDAAAVTTFRVDFGDFTGAATAWAAIGSPVIALTNLTSGTAQGNVYLVPVVDTTALDLHASKPRYLGLFLTALGANALNAAYSMLKVDIKLKRTNGLRS